MQKLTEEFPLLNQYLYANTAASGLLYDGLLQWRQEHDLDFLIDGIPAKKVCVGLISETRTTVGTFFNCSRESVALIPNFSLGLNMLLEGLDQDARVLLLEGDYPSVNWPFENRDFIISYATIDENLEENILAKIEQDRISVLALSLVQWVNGIQIDLKFLKRLKQNYPDLIILADGTQFCGTRDFDFEKSGLDVLLASGYKWLLAGHGNGFALFKEEIKDRFHLRTIGLNAANGDVSKNGKVRFAKRLEPGHLDTLSFGSLKFSLDYLTRLGMQTVARQNEQLSVKAKIAFAELGLLEEAVLKREGHSTIFNIKGNERIYGQLAQKDVICSLRGTGIRFSFHFYNTENDIDRLVEILKTGK